MSLAATAVAQEGYPARPITVVVPFGAGSGTDIITRSLAKSLGDQLGATVIVDNKPGANGGIGAQTVAKAKRDGYTLLVGSATTNAANYAFYTGRLGYDTGSFQMIAGLQGGPLNLHVPTNSPWHTVAELVAAAKRKESNFSCGSGNAVTQVACEIFKRQAGISTVTVPYKSNPQSLTDVVGGQVTFAFSDPSAAKVFVKGNQLRAIATAALARNPALPDVPTFAEQGMGDFNFTAWGALFAPTGTPAPVIAKLNAAVNVWLDSPEAVQLRGQSGSVPMKFSVAQAERFSKAEIARSAQYIKESGVRAE